MHILTAFLDIRKDKQRRNSRNMFFLSEIESHSISRQKNFCCSKVKSQIFLIQRNKCYLVKKSRKYYPLAIFHKYRKNTLQGLIFYVTFQKESLQNSSKSAKSLSASLLIFVARAFNIFEGIFLSLRFTFIFLNIGSKSRATKNHLCF